jgi:neutral ceramidase
MKSIASSSLPILLLTVLLVVGCQHNAPQARSASTLRVGAAEVDITPPVGYRMAGYFNERFSTGVHDPLKAKAIVLQQGSQQMALVSCDLVGVKLADTAAARAQASERTGIPVANIVICATHSHTGPLYEGPLREYFHAAALKTNGEDPHERADYSAFLRDRLVKAIIAAQATLRLAELQAGIAKQDGLSFNRRYWMKNGKVVFNPGVLNPDIVRPAGPIDLDVGMLLARAPGGRPPFACLTTFAVHSDTVGGTEFSADYEYFLQQKLRKAFGSEFVSLFGLGTCGDINHINVKENAGSRQRFDTAERIGGTLGQVVIEHAKDLPAITHPALAARSTTLQVPMQEVTPEQVADARKTMEQFKDPSTPFLSLVAAVRVLDLASRGSLCPMEVQVFRLDRETAIVCLPCEIFVELGLAIKQASPFKRTLVIEICNDRPSYVPTQKAFTEGSYEVTNARVKPGAGEMLVDAAVRLLKQLKAE